MEFNEACRIVAVHINNLLSSLVDKPIERIRAFDTSVKYHKVYGLSMMTFPIRPEICVLSSGHTLVATALGKPTEAMRKDTELGDDDMVMWFFNVQDSEGFMPIMFPHFAKMQPEFSTGKPVTLFSVKKQAHEAITISDHNRLGAIAAHAALAQTLNRGVKL